MNRRICFIGAGLKGGGQERAFTSMANYFTMIGHQVIIINLFRTEQFYELNTEIEVFWPNVVRNKHHRIVYATLILPYLRRTIRKVKPDVLLSFGEWFNPFVILSTRFLGVPLYVFDRMGPNMKLDPIISTARKALYRFAKGIIVQTNAAARIAAGNSNAKNIIVIPNPVNVVNTVTSIKKKQILTIGRLSREKGQIILIEAFSRLSSHEWTLHLVGDGPERTNLERKVSSLGISDKVVFHGHLKDFSRILGESEIFVLPSLYEGFPNALIEAMSVPLPCISSNCVAGPSEIIEDGTNGLLVEPANVEALVASLNRLIENPVLRKKLATEAYKVRDTLAWDNIYQKYLHPIITNNG